MITTLALAHAQLSPLEAPGFVPKEEEEKTRAKVAHPFLSTL
jgi:hypothetical protein